MRNFHRRRRHEMFKVLCYFAREIEKYFVSDTFEQMITTNLAYLKLSFHLVFSRMGHLFNYITIYDLTGKLFSEIKVQRHDQMFTLNTTDWPAGSYRVVVNNNNTMLTHHALVIVK